MFYFCSTGGWYRTIVEQTNRESLGAPQSPNPINPLSPIPFLIHPFHPLSLSYTYHLSIPSYYHLFLFRLITKLYIVIINTTYSVFII